MLLVADVGNTETTLGLAEDERIVAHWRVTTEASRTPDEVHLLLHNLLAASGRGGVKLTGAAIGSVVPGVTTALAEAASRLAGTPAVIVDAQSPLGITLAVDEPMTVGADRIINTLAASRLYQSDCIVVDLGTATTYDCITKDGVFLGQPVLDARGLMGQVVEVMPYTARVLLLTDTTHSIPVQVNRNGLRAIASGTGNPERLELRKPETITDSAGASDQARRVDILAAQ